MQFLKILFSPITAPIRFVQKNFKATLLILFLIFLYNSSDTKNLQKENLEEIVLNGAIMNADEILSKINSAKKDNNIKGVLLIVNSPGGAVAPSVEIAYAIRELNRLKPVIAYAAGTMASGSYYSSIWASKIIANPGSMVGSIGVIMQSYDASKLLDNIGIKTQTVKVGTYKEAGTPTRKWTKEETAELNKVIQDTYNMFVSDVAHARKLDIKNHKIFADAHIFTASQAKKVGLIDEVDTISRAKELLVMKSGVKKAIWKRKNKMDKFMEKLVQGTISNVSSNISNKLLAF
jgi:protease-4